MSPAGPLKNYLELCRRLGIRYISGIPPATSNPKTVAPLPSPPHQEKKEMPKPGAALSLSEERSSLSTPVPTVTAPHWLTQEPDCVEAMELKAYDADIHDCNNCPLGATRKCFVFGSGNPKAEVMFIGEAPGADEDAQGLPFVGRAGQLLTKIIESTKTWQRQEVFICNVLKCRPPGNRTPLPEEVEQCRPYLEEQVRIIKPKLIMALGASAAQALLLTKEPVGKLRNRWHDFSGIPLRVTYHPAALLRFDGYKKDVWEDMKEFTAKYAQFVGK